jgi:ankyrin repeat protein
MGESRRVAPYLRHAPIPDGPIDSLKITLHRTGCYGTCPDYTVEMGGDGTVQYHGEAFVLVEGDHASHVASEDVRCLLSDFRAADFWSLRPKYWAGITDQPTYELTLSIAGQSKTVVDYMGQLTGMPRVVTDLENAVDLVANDESWIIGNARTLPALEAEHFDFRSRAGANLLARAAGDASDEIVRGLIANGAPLDGRANYYGDYGTVEIAALGGRLEILRALINAGVFETGGPALRSAVLRASVASERADVVAEVLKQHPDVDSQDVHGDTALHLIRNGPHPHLADDDAPHEDVAIIRVLLQAGADPNIPNGEGKTVLHDVLDPDEARAFIAGGAKLEVKDNEGETPLLAAFTEDVAVVLIEAGADPLAKYSTGETFIEVARAKKWKKALAAVKVGRTSSAAHRL